MSHLLSAACRSTFIHVPQPVLKGVQERTRVSPTSRGRVPLPGIFIYLFLIWKWRVWCILGGILCDLELQKSKRETRCRPGKSKDAGSPTLATRPHFKPWPQPILDQWVDGSLFGRVTRKNSSSWLFQQHLQLNTNDISVNLISVVLAMRPIWVIYWLNWV